jgi:choline dehydrogenase-like flavoprotein
VAKKSGAEKQRLEEQNSGKQPWRRWGALGSLVMGNDPDHSVVDVHGRVHGLHNLYVADGSVLPRQPGQPGADHLRLGEHLAKQRNRKQGVE